MQNRELDAKYEVNLELQAFTKHGVSSMSGYAKKVPYKFGSMCVHKM